MWFYILYVCVARFNATVTCVFPTDFYPGKRKKKSNSNSNSNTRIGNAYCAILAHCPSAWSSANFLQSIILGLSTQNCAKKDQHHSWNLRCDDIIINFKFKMWQYIYNISKTLSFFTSKIYGLSLWRRKLLQKMQIAILCGLVVK